LYLSSDVKLYVTKIVSANVILGNPWLKSTNTIVGGSRNRIIVRSLNLSPVHCVATNANPQLLSPDLSVDSNLYDVKLLTDQFSDVFTTASLTKLPPH
jgi:hypothetical protein